LSDPRLNARFPPEQRRKSRHAQRNRNAACVSNATLNEKVGEHLKLKDFSNWFGTL
jgi:hypothetical protein